MNRVVITGMGVISGSGNTPDSLFEKVLSGETSIDRITRFDTTDYKAHFASEVKEFDVQKYMDKKDAKRTDRYCQFAIAAATEAFQDSGLENSDFNHERAGVVFGSGIGGLITLEEEKMKLENKGPNRVSPFFIPMMISNMACGKISMKYGLKGTCYCPVTACATSTHAIGEAFRNIKHGYSDIIIAGGAESTITPLAIAGFSNMTALSTADNKDEASIPFDSRRSGFVMGEGAGAIVLESLDSAKKRGAKIYGEIVGYGSTADAYHITSPAPDGNGAARAMMEAMKEAGVTPNMVDYINAHGTGTPLNDEFETLAIKSAFGDEAYNVNISSTKGVTGHLLGAAGVVEAICCVKAINFNIIPPTANLISPDEKLDLNYTPLKPVERKVDYAMSNSLGFGGSNATILIKKGE